jgi:hypothetical protein
MNAILLGAACFGALAVFLTSDPKVIAEAKAAEAGSMTHEVSTNPATGAVEETNVIAFLDP